MHERRRLLNGETSQAGPMRASFTEVVDVVTQEPALPAATEAGSEARELTAQGTAGGLEAAASGDGRVNDADEDSGVEELADGDGVSPGETQGADDGEGGESQSPLQVFTETTGLRDDWLHRGMRLGGHGLVSVQCRHRTHSLPRLLAHRPNAGNVFAFDAHYRLANSHCQQITARLRAVPRLLAVTPATERITRAGW